MNKGKRSEKKKVQPCSQAMIPSRKTQMMPWARRAITVLSVLEPGQPAARRHRPHRVHRLVAVHLSCGPSVPWMPTIPKHGWVFTGLGLQAAEGRWEEQQYRPKAEEWMILWPSKILNWSRLSSRGFSRVTLREISTLFKGENKYDLINYLFKIQFTQTTVTHIP